MDVSSTNYRIPSKRREFLKALSAGTALATSGGVVTATEQTDDREQFEQHMGRALQITDPEKRSSYLERHDISYAYDEGFLETPLGSTNESSEEVVERKDGDEKKRRKADDRTVSAQKLEDPEDSGVKLTIHGANYSREDYYGIFLTIEYYLAFECEYMFGSGNWDDVSFGEGPNDAAALMWGTNQKKYWEIHDSYDIDDSVYDYSEYIEWEDGSYDPSGAIGFTVDDEQRSEDWAQDRFGWSGEPSLNDCSIFSLGDRKDDTVVVGVAGVYLEPTGNHSPSDRIVQAMYTHAWEKDVSNVGLSVGVPPSASLTITPSSEVDQTQTQTGENYHREGEGNLIIRQSDID